MDKIGVIYMDVVRKSFNMVSYVLATILCIMVGLAHLLGASLTDGLFMIVVVPLAFCQLVCAFCRWKTAEDHWAAIIEMGILLLFGAMLAHVIMTRILGGDALRSACYYVALLAVPEIWRRARMLKSYPERLSKGLLWICMILLGYFLISVLLSFVVLAGEGYSLPEVIDGALSQGYLAVYYLPVMIVCDLLVWFSRQIQIKA